MTTCSVGDRMCLVESFARIPCYSIGERPKLIRQLSVCCVRRVPITVSEIPCGRVTVPVIVPGATLLKAMWRILPLVSRFCLCRTLMTR